MSRDEPTPRARFAYGGLDRVIHEKARLGILTALVSEREGIAFNDLKRLCELTDGNLSRHLRTLAEAGLVAAEREEGEGDGRAQSVYHLTPDGRARFLEYLAELERVVRDAAPARAAGGRRRPRPRAGGAGA